LRLLYTVRAIADLTEIADYLVSRSPVGAKRVRTAIVVTLKTVVDFRHSGLFNNGLAVCDN
jgi:plasmid stabilization system protein ParE